MLRHAAPAGSSDLTALSDDERSAFREEVRQYLLENPEVIVEAINILEQRQAEAEALADKELVAAQADELFNDGYSRVGGNPAATSRWSSSWTTAAAIAGAPCPRWTRCWQRTETSGW